MSYANFKPTIWSKFIQTAIEQKRSLVDYCNRQFEGEVKLGGKVKIIGAVAPEIYDYDKVNGLKDPETQKGTDLDLEITQAKAFNIKIDDIDKAQVNGVDVLNIISEEGGKELRNYRSRFVSTTANLAAVAEDSLVGLSGELNSISTEAKVKAVIDDAILWLKEQGVEEGRIDLPWWMYQLFKNQLVQDKTHNDILVAKGVIGMYDGFEVLPSTHLQKLGDYDTFMARSNKAIAFAAAINEVEAYRPEKYFSDAIKGLDVYGACVSRPEQLYIGRTKKTA